MGSGKSKNQDIADQNHYNVNHRGKPHENSLNRPDPRNLHKTTEPLKSAYTGLYIALGFAALVLLLVIFGMYWDYRRKRRSANDEEKKDKRKLNQIHQQELRMKEDSSYSGSLTTTAEVQPKQNAQDYFPSAPKKGLNFGAYNVQPSDSNSKNDLRETASYASSNVTHEMPLPRMFSKMESMPYTDFNLEESERTPLQDYFRLTPEIQRLDSHPEFGDEKGFDRNSATMPRRDSVKTGIESKI